MSPKLQALAGAVEAFTRGVLVAVGGLLSALLTNDVVVVAMTPLLVSLTLARGLNPVPLLLGFFLVALFIWLAENIGTFANAWTYPDQRAGWHMVGLAKLGSWYLLMIISFVLVSLVHGIRRDDQIR